MATQQKRNIPRLTDPKFYLDRELSWLAFNDRVIEEAEDPTTPLLERLRFLGIASSNLDEFFMVRVSGIQEQVAAGIRTRNPAGYTPQEQLTLVYERVREQVARFLGCFRTQIEPALRDEGIRINRVAELRGEQRRFVQEYFDHEVFPVLTPLAVDSAHPFPHLRNLSLNLAVLLEPPEDHPGAAARFAVVQVPQVIDRVTQLPAPEDRYEIFLLEDLISSEIEVLFPGQKVREVRAFRVTRDADIEFAEEEADDLLKTIEEELRDRERGSAVRLTVEQETSDDLCAILAHALGLQAMQVFRVTGPIAIQDVANICNTVPREDLKYPPFTPATRDPIRPKANVFAVVSREEVLLHHPYESFGPVVDFIEQAASDPNVLAIKQTLYRTSGDSQIVKALMRAAGNGKQVAALLELKARFDEQRNISWARALEKSGVHVVYGLVGLKTHAKIAMVVRREEGGIRRYVHLGTGNYNPNTARLYTDLGLLTCDPDLCDDATELFNLLTGYSDRPEWAKMIVAPVDMRDKFTELIEAERKKALAGKRGRIRAKFNSLEDPRVIRELYAASQAGVQIDLIIRGLCCLRPGVEGVSDNIRVYSIVDRFLEHSRVFIFGDAGDEKVYLSSADWMRRNLDRRVELVFPIDDKALKHRMIHEVFGMSMGDNVKRRQLLPDGRYVRVPRREGEAPVRSQFAFLDLERKIRERAEKQELADALAGAAEAADAKSRRLPLRPAQPAARTPAPIVKPANRRAKAETPAPQPPPAPAKKTKRGKSAT
ncbi:MAG: polyphosphate kinase 1 [Candidatus Sumerlaeia bacterium]|nr:polyphosphate kinase 1 [Candidatus Sumerlaeia bacterium]